MRKAIFRFSVIAIGLFFLIKCDEYEFPESPYPAIETLPVVNISETGVTFQAAITRPGEKEITDHGFVWGLTENLSFESENKVQLGPKTGIGSFEADAKSGLYEGETYYVKAFVATEDYFVYGEPLSFTSKGSTPPIINGFAPSVGTLADTITINGKYFSSRSLGIDVKFGTIKSKIVTSNDSTIVCIVPNGIPNSVPISVTVSGNITQSTNNFIVAPPVINDFASKTGTFQDIVTIRGTNFSWIKENNKVKFNEHNAEIMEISKTVIKVSVPTSIIAKENSLSVTINNQTATSNGKYTILPPSIYSISSNQGFIKNTIQINGNNFCPLSAGSKVLFEGNLATIISSSKTTIVVKVPEGIYKNRTFKIEVTVAEQIAFSGDFTLQDAWIRKADLPLGDLPPIGPRRYGATSFIINGNGYAGLGGDGIDNSFYRFDPIENTWSKVASFPGGARGFTTSFVIGDKAYVGLGIEADPYIGNGNSRKDLWRYDPQLNTWEQMADLPISSDIGFAYGFTVNGKGYIVTSDWADNFWEYDPNLNYWTQKEDLAFMPRYFQDAGFVINNRLFIVRANDTPSSEPNQLWEYDYNSGSWVQRTSIGASHYTWSGGPNGTGFTLGANGYIIVNNGEQQMYKYDLTSDSWEQLAYSSFPARSYPIVFVINSKAYFGTGNGTGADIWEYDPGYQQ